MSVKLGYSNVTIGNTHNITWSVKGDFWSPMLDQNLKIDLQEYQCLPAFKSCYEYNIDTAVSKVIVSNPPLTCDEVFGECYGLDYFRKFCIFIQLSQHFRTTPLSSRLGFFARF